METPNHEALETIAREAEAKDATPQDNAERETVLHFVGYVESGAYPPAFEDAKKNLETFMDSDLLNWEYADESVDDLIDKAYALFESFVTLRAVRQYERMKKSD